MVKALDVDAAAQVMEEMAPVLRKIIINYLGPEKAAGILERMSVDEAVSLIRKMPKQEAKIFLSYLQGNKISKLEHLISYADDTAGGLMTTDYAEARPTQTVAEVTEELRRMSDTMHSILYVYVTNDDHKLLGVVSLRKLLLATPETRVKSILKVFPASSVIHVNQHIEKIIKVMTKYNLYTSAVVDEKKRLVGMVTIDDVMRHLFPKA